MVSIFFSLLWNNSRKQSSGTSSVTTSIDDLRKLKDEYEVAQRAFEEYLKSPLSSTKNFNFEMEDEHFKHFFQLSQYGKKIENEYFQQKKLASIDVSVKEYIHENCYVKEHDKKRNHRTSGKNDHYNRDRPGGMFKKCVSTVTIIETLVYYQYQNYFFYRQKCSC